MKQNSFRDYCHLLENQISFSKETEYFFSEKAMIYITSGHVNGREVVLKVAGKANKNKTASLKKEIATYAIFKSQKNSFPLDRMAVKIDDHGENENIIWILRRFYQGDTLTNYINRQKSLLNGYDFISPQFQDKPKEIITELLNILKPLQKIDNEDLIDSGAKFVPRYKKDIEDYDTVTLSKMLDVDLSSSLLFYNEYKDQFFSEDNLVVCMGDFIPPNMIINKENKIVLTDFEWLCYDNQQLDITFLWLFLWRYQKWQKELELSVIDGQDGIFFRSNAIRMILDWYCNLLDPRNEKTELLEKNIDLCKNHIWTRYLLAAGES